MLYFAIWAGGVISLIAWLVWLGSRIKPIDRPDGIYSKDNEWFGL